MQANKFGLIQEVYKVKTFGTTQSISSVAFFRCLSAIPIYISLFRVNLHLNLLLHCTPHLPHSYSPLALLSIQIERLQGELKHVPKDLYVPLIH
jgi:hypothetical protein